MIYVIRLAYLPETGSSRLRGNATNSGVPLALPSAGLRFPVCVGSNDADVISDAS